MCTPVAKFGGLDELLCFQFIQKPLSTLGFSIILRSIQNQEWKRSFTERPARSVHDLMGRMVSSEKERFRTSQSRMVSSVFRLLSLYRVDLICRGLQNLTHNWIVLLLNDFLTNWQGNAIIA
jgi:hypothetical protein